MQALGVQVLDWRHLKNALMEHIATQLVLDIVFCVQKVIGEVLGISTCWPQISTDHSSIHSFMFPFIDIIGWCFKDGLPISPGSQNKPSIHDGWMPQISPQFIQPSVHVVHFVHLYILARWYIPMWYKWIVQLIIHTLLNISCQLRSYAVKLQISPGYPTVHQAGSFRTLVHIGCMLHTHTAADCPTVRPCSVLVTQKGHHLLYFTICMLKSRCII